MRSGADSHPSVGLTAAVFAPMCGFAAAHWAGLVASPPGGRVAAVVIVATLLGLILGLTARLEPEHRLNARVVRVVAVAIAAIAALVAIGVQPQLLSPAGWDQLSAGLGRGFAGVPGTHWPYAGTSEWVRLTILLAIPLMSVPAAAFAMWPPAPGPGGPEAAAVRRGGALLLLLTLFGLAAAQHPLPDNVARGGALLVLIAAWLFIPRLTQARPAAAASGAGAVLVAGLAAIPLATAIAPQRPLITTNFGERPHTSAPQRVAPEGGTHTPKAERRQTTHRTSGETHRQERRSQQSQHDSGSRAQGQRQGGGSSAGQGAGSARQRPESGNGAVRPGGGSPFWLILALVVAIVAIVRFLVLPRLRRRAEHARSPADAAAELRHALERLGWRVPPSVTLAELEPLLADAAGSPAARYARRLRDWRYSPYGENAPSREDRRALRRSLTAGHGPTTRLRGVLALPPAPLAALFPRPRDGVHGGRFAPGRA